MTKSLYNKRKGEEKEEKKISIFYHVLGTFLQS